jgi:hypothetical protein
MIKLYNIHSKSLVIRAMQVLWGCRLMTTSKGYIGLASRAAKQKDVIFVLLGCDVHAVLNPNWNHAGSKLTNPLSNTQSLGDLGKRSREDSTIRVVRRSIDNVLRMHSRARRD